MSWSCNPQWMIFRVLKDLSCFNNTLDTTEAILSSRAMSRCQWFYLCDNIGKITQNISNIMKDYMVEMKSIKFQKTYQGSNLTYETGLEFILIMKFYRFIEINQKSSCRFNRHFTSYKPFSLRRHIAWQVNRHIHDGKITVKEYWQQIEPLTTREIHMKYSRDTWAS
jgi:hypothetical protein